MPSISIESICLAAKLFTFCSYDHHSSSPINHFYQCIYNHYFMSFFIHQNSHQIRNFTPIFQVCTWDRQIVGQGTCSNTVGLNWMKFNTNGGDSTSKRSCQTYLLSKLLLLALCNCSSAQEHIFETKLQKPLINWMMINVKSINVQLLP